MSFITSLFSEIGKRKLSTYASSGCYYLVMSLVPIAMLLCAILRYTPFSQEMIITYASQYFTDSLADVVNRIITPLYQTGGGTLTLSIVLTLYSASAATKALMAGLDAAYATKRESNFIKYTLSAIGYLLLLVIALIFTLSILVYGESILAQIGKYITVPGIIILLLSKLRFLIGFFFLTGFFTMLYTVMPACEVKLKHQIPGAVFSAIVWVLFSSIFSFYISVSNKFGAFGIIGTMMVSMMWIYYSLFVVMLGGLINSALTPQEQVPWNMPFPRDLFTP